MDWITPQVAVGNYLDARSLGADIDAVLCLREACCADRDDVDALSVPLIDGAGNDARAIRNALDFLGEVVGA